MYYVIYNSDGETFILEYTKSELERHLNSEGHLHPDTMHYLENLNEHNTNYWSQVDGKRPILIIKGQIITPKIGALVVD